MKLVRILTLLSCMLGSLQALLAGQTGDKSYPFTVTVQDSRTQEPIGYASVMLKQGERYFAGVCNDIGVYTFGQVPAGNYELRVNFMGYKVYNREVVVGKDMIWLAPLVPDAVHLSEVVVTASESRGMTSSSKIDRQAMEHLQPSSFSDLLELLPGERTTTPVMGAANLIRLREAGGGINTSGNDTKYDISSLGTSFLMDGVPISTGANMQYVSGASNDNRDVTGRGLDMRTIPTDDIEHVEIVRGIPSVEYGDLTSGLIKIERRKGGKDLTARFKADARSKLAFAGKGFEWRERNLTLNTGIDFLDSKIDPRNNLENYKRLTASARLSKTWKYDNGELNLNSNLDYGGSFDNDKIDPDINFHKEDSYRSSYNRFALANNLVWKNRKDRFFRSLELRTSVSLQKDKIEQVKYVQLTRPMPTPNSTEEGEHDGLYLSSPYVAELEVDGRPLNAFAKLVSAFNTTSDKLIQDIRVGADWSMNKNLGRGQIYDPFHPVYPGVGTRPRPYNDVPAGHDLSFFAEDHIRLFAGEHKFEVMAGLRATTMLNLSPEYTLHGKFFFDPRVNVRWALPGVALAGRPLRFEIGGGVGWHTKTPTLTHLYPNKVYSDLIQLNYYHSVPAYRRLNMMTYIIDQTNYDLSVARNFKWEVRGDVSYSENRLSVTYFREDVTSGFRDQATRYKIMTYKKYDNGSIDASALQGPPRLEDMTYTMDTAITPYSVTTNGSRLYKEGVEFQFSSKRIPALQTRLTISGAWFRTTYSNSQPYYRTSDKMIDGKSLPYIGLFDDPDGYTAQSCNTNFMLDTYLPKLKLGFSASVQCLWFYRSTTLWKSGTPVAYIDLQGVSHPYTEESSKDTYLQWLQTHYNEALFKERVQEPFNINVNLKVTKRLYREKIELAFYVNALVSYRPAYTQNGVVVRQMGRSPDFGMELNFKL